MRIAKFLICFIAISFVSGGCKKSVEKVAADLMVQLITDNTWVIVKYAEGAENKTSDYSGYDFKFYNNWTVDAINNGITEAEGTWSGSQVTQSVTSEFPSAGAPLNKLNGVWIVLNTKSKPWRVFSHRFEGGTEYFLDLQAK